MYSGLIERYQSIHQEKDMFEHKWLTIDHVVVVRPFSNTIPYYLLLIKARRDLHSQLSPITGWSTALNGLSLSVGLGFTLYFLARAAGTILSSLRRWSSLRPSKRALREKGLRWMTALQFLQYFQPFEVLLSDEVLLHVTHLHVQICQKKSKDRLRDPTL